MVTLMHRYIIGDGMIRENVHLMGRVDTVRGHEKKKLKSLMTKFDCVAGASNAFLVHCK